MGHALGIVLPIAVAVAIFPVPIIAVVLLLGSDRGTAKGLAFVVAWCTGLVAVGAIVLVVAGTSDAGDAEDPATWVSLVLLGLGSVLLALALTQWRGRPRVGEETPMPGWMRRIDDFTPFTAGKAGFALSALNPKNVLLTVAAATEIVQVGLLAGEEVAVLLVFVLIASVGVLSPLVMSLALGERAREPLNGVREWMARYSAAIMTVLFLVIGAKLIGDAISGFSGS